MASQPETGKHQVSPEHQRGHTGWLCCVEGLRLMAHRIRAGECTVVQTVRDFGFGRDNPPRLIAPMPTETLAVFLTDQWCVTHDCVSDYGHWQDIKRKGRDAEVLHNG